MRIVRTIGQAFEVCHKLNLEKDLREESAEQKVEEEPTPSTSSKALLSPTKSDASQSRVVPAVQIQHSQSAEAAEVATPVNSSIDDKPDSAAVPSVQRGRFASLTHGSGGVPSTGPLESTSSSAADSANTNVSAAKECGSGQTVISTSTSNIPVKMQSAASQIPPSPVSVQYQQTNVGAAGETALTVSNFPGLLPLQHSLSQSRTWAGGQPLISPYATIARDSSELYGALSPTSSASARGIFPYSISSPQMLPCGNVPFQQYYTNPSGYLSPERIVSPLPQVVEQGVQSSKTIAVNQAYDSYSLNLLRGQLDQAQQQAQIAVAQVQLLREHLSAETTARLESQNRTQQLFLANKELIEQVQALVSRLQQLEARVAVSQPGSSIPVLQPSTSASTPRQPDKPQLHSTPTAMHRKVQETMFHVQQLQNLQKKSSSDSRKLRLDSLPLSIHNSVSLSSRANLAPTSTKRSSESGIIQN